MPVGLRRGDTAKSTTVFLVLVILFTLAPNLQAEWAWVTNQVTATSSSNQAVAEFVFQNKGNATVTVKELKFSCSCDDFSFKAIPAAPGKPGILRVYLQPGNLEETRQFVVFGVQGTTPTPLFIHLPKVIEPLEAKK